LPVCLGAVEMSVGRGARRGSLMARACRAVASSAMLAVIGWLLINQQGVLSVGAVPADSAGPPMTQALVRAPSLAAMPHALPIDEILTQSLAVGELVRYRIVLDAVPAGGAVLEVSGQGDVAMCVQPLTPAVDCRFEPVLRRGQRVSLLPDLGEHWRVVLRSEHAGKAQLSWSFD